MTKNTREATDILAYLDDLEMFISSITRHRDNVKYMADDVTQTPPILCRPSVLNVMGEVMTDQIAEATETLRKARRSAVNMLH